MMNNPNSPTQDGSNGPSFYPRPPSGPRRTIWLWSIGALATLLIIGTISVFAFMHQNPSSSPQADAQATATAASTTVTTPTTTSGSTGGSTENPSGGSIITLSQARATVTLYYGDINSKNYQSAYNRWGKGYRNGTSYQTFAQGFATTQRDGLQLGRVVQLANGTVKVPVTVTAIVTSSGSNTVNTYQGYYIAGLEVGQPRLLNANLQFTNSNKDSVKRAISLVEQYYDDINAKDYTDAYAIWGSAYHTSTSSYQFAKGFNHTQRVSIRINSEGATILEAVLECTAATLRGKKSKIGEVLCEVRR